MVVGIWRHTTTCAVSSGAHSGQERNSRISGKNERHTVNGALMRPKVLHELHASRTFLPELEVPVRGPGQQELVAGGHCNTGDHVAVHEAALVHGRRWQARQVRCFMRQHLRPRTEDGWRSPYSLYARCGQALTHACKTSQAVIPDCSKSGRAHRPSQAQFLFAAVHCWLPQSPQAGPVAACCGWLPGGSGELAVRRMSAGLDEAAACGRSAAELALSHHCRSSPASLACITCPAFLSVLRLSN